MAEKDGKRSERHRSPASRRGGRAAQLTLGHLVLAIIAGLIIGALVGYQLGRYSMRGDGASIGNEAPRTDAFGRPPGDPHYGHNHP